MTQVSVIVPCFNQARFLARALTSLAEQSHADVDVVVVNDGSTDDTEKVARSFASRPGFRYLSQENRGLPAARNAGIALATGDYLSFLDADDYYHPDKLAAEAEVLDTEPSLGFVYCDIVSVDDCDWPLDVQHPVATSRTRLSGNLLEPLLKGGYFPPHTVMVRRSALEDVGRFDESLGGHADYDLWLRLSASGHRAFFLDCKLAYYRRHEESMSGDGEHMAETRRRSLVKLATSHPGAVGAAAAALQDHASELYEANRWLRERWEEVLEKAKGAELGPEGRQSYSFLNRFKRGRLLSGSPEQAAVWECDIGNEPARAIYLQPPARLKFTLDSGGEGRLSFAAALHPECWENPASGGCQFIVLVDDRIALMAALDPLHHESDRRWHRFELDVPRSPTGQHEVVLETRTVGPSSDFRWALWREPRFVWKDPIETEAPEEALARTE